MKNYEIRKDMNAKKQYLNLKYGTLLRESTVYYMPKINLKTFLVNCCDRLSKYLIKILAEFNPITNDPL